MRAGLWVTLAMVCNPLISPSWCGGDHRYTPNFYSAAVIPTPWFLIFLRRWSVSCAEQNGILAIPAVGVHTSGGKGLLASNRWRQRRPRPRIPSIYLWPWLWGMPGWNDAGVEQSNPTSCLAWLSGPRRVPLSLHGLPLCTWASNKLFVCDADNRCRRKPMQQRHAMPCHAPVLH